ncbi:MAG: beta-lactamase family protein [Anaerolineaceae bacterium]|nr:beta-lactamase family protein [Anaerolineaceae bacterium]
MEASIQPESVGFSSERLARIPAVMQAYIDRRETGGILALVERKGKTVFVSKCGFQDLGMQTPIAYDSLFRIYSMTKPIISLGLMMLFEEAAFQLKDPLHIYLPEFRHVKVLSEDGHRVEPKTAPTILQLLNHTAGMTYGTFGNTPVDKLYRAANLREPGINLEEMVGRMAELPLLYHPGERWVYSMATSVVGRLIEVLSGMNLNDYLQQRIFQPLGMRDTTFSVPDEKLPRLMTCYKQTLKKGIAEFDGVSDSAFRNVTLFRGDGGLVSTLKDYLQFSRLVLGQGTLGEVCLIGRKTFDLMRQNHITQDLMPLDVVEPMPGLGFGLGFSIVMDTALTGKLGSAGELSWSGMASTTFWVDPAEDLIAILLTQLVPLKRLRLEDDFRTLVYQALVG